jgi:hypothetical protein
LSQLEMAFWSAGSGPQVIVMSAWHGSKPQWASAICRAWFVQGCGADCAAAGVVVMMSVRHASSAPTSGFVRPSMAIPPGVHAGVCGGRTDDRCAPPELQSRRDFA